MGSVTNLISSRGFIVLNKRLVQQLGFDAAIMLGELASEYEYWTSVGKAEDGFFHSSIENVRENTTLTAQRQRTALKALKGCGIVEQVTKGLPQKRYFRIDENAILALLNAPNQKNDCVQNGAIKSAESVNKKRRIGAIRSAESEQLEAPNRSRNNNKYNKNKDKIIPPVTTNVVTSPKGEAPTLIDKDKYNNNIHNAYTSLSKGGVGESLSLDAAEPTCEPPAAAIPQKKPAPIDERFEQFWVVYPRKIGKGAARKAFAKIKPSDELLKRMVVAVVTQSKSDAWTKDGGQFIPNPATWLNQERWEDEIVQTRKHDFAERQVTDSDFDDGFFVDLMSREPRKTPKKDGGGK